MYLHPDYPQLVGAFSAVQPIPATPGIGCDCGCDGACGCSGLGADVTTQTCPPYCGDQTIVDKLWGALTTQLPIGGVGIPVWVLAVAAFLAAGSLLSGPSSRRRYT